MINRQSNENRQNFFTSYSIFLGLFGTASSLLTFPDGIFIGFFFGVIGLTLAVLARRGGRRGTASITGIVLSSISVALSVSLYLILLLFYDMIKDPEIWSRFSDYYNALMQSSGMSPASFSQLLQIY